MAHSFVLLGSRERLSENFVNNIADIYRYSKDDIISALKKVTTEKLPLLRIKSYIKLLEIFPEIEDYDLVTRGKKQGLIDDIYEIGNSVNSQKLNKVTDFVSVRHVDTDDLLTSDVESNSALLKT